MVNYDQIRDRFLMFAAMCREFAGANPSTADFFQSLAVKFAKDAERVKQDARIIAESLTLLRDRMS